MWGIVLTLAGLALDWLHVCPVVKRIWTPAYVMSWTIKRFVAEALVRHLGRNPFLILGPPFEPVLPGAAVLVVFWAILYWMYKRGTFIKI